MDSKKRKEKDVQIFKCKTTRFPPQLLTSTISIVWFGRPDPHPDCNDNIFQLVWESSFPHRWFNKLSFLLFWQSMACWSAIKFLHSCISDRRLASHDESHYITSLHHHDQLNGKIGLATKTDEVKMWKVL